MVTDKKSRPTQMWEKNKTFTKKPQLPHPSGFGHRLWWPRALLLRPQALASTRRRSTVATLACAPAPVSAPGAHAAGAVGQWGGHVGWPVVPADLAKMHIRRPSQNTGAQEDTFDSFASVRFRIQPRHCLIGGDPRCESTLLLWENLAIHAEGVCLTCSCQQNICFDGKGKAHVSQAHSYA